MTDFRLLFIEAFGAKQRSETRKLLVEMQSRIFRYNYSILRDENPWEWCSISPYLNSERSIRSMSYQSKNFYPQPHEQTGQQIAIARTCDAAILIGINDFAVLETEVSHELTGWGTPYVVINSNGWDVIVTALNDLRGKV